MASFTIPSVFTVVDRYSGTMTKMASKTSALTAAQERSISRVSDASFNMGRNAGLAGLAMVAGLGVATKAAIDFEVSMSNVSTLIDTNVENMGSMSDAVLAMASSLPVPLEQLSGSLYDIRSAGISAADAMSTLEMSAKLGKAGLASTTEATNIMTSAMNAFASEGLTSEQIADTLFKTVKAGKTNLSQVAQAFGATAPIVQSAGVTLADFSAATAALTTVGTPASQAQNQIRAAIVALQKPTKEMEMIFRRLGVTSEKELIKKFGGTVGAFQAVNEAGTKMRLNMAKAWSSVEAGAAVTSLTGATNKAYVETLSSMTTGSEALTEAFNKQASTGAAMAQKFKNNLQVLAIQFGNALIPVMNSFIETISPMIQRVITFMSENKELVKWLALTAVGVTALTIGISVGAFAIGIITKGILIWNTVTKAATAVQWFLNAALAANPIGAVVLAIAAAVAAVVLIIKYWDQWGASVALVGGIIAAFGSPVIAVFAAIVSVVMSIRRNWDGIVNAFKSDGILAGIKMIGATLLDAVLMPVQQLLELLSNIPGLSIASTGAEKIKQLRESLGVEMGVQNEPINPEKERQSSVQETITRSQQNVNVNISNDSGLPARLEGQTSPIPVNITSTLSSLYR